MSTSSSSTDLRNRIIFTIAILAIYRFGTFVPLPGVDPETGMNDGSVRTYGTWTGVHTESGKEFALKSYHPMAFKDGKIVGGGDYFDFGGFMASFQ